MAATLFKKRLNHFLGNFNITGVRYLGERCNVVGRLFWGVMLIVSFCGMLQIFILTLKRSYEDMVSIGFDTAYLDWRSKFPSVSICLSKGRSSKALVNLTTDVPYKGSQLLYMRTIHSYVFANPNQNFGLGECRDLNRTCGVDVRHLRRRLLPSECSAIMAEVSFAGEAVEHCEDLFKLHETEMGYCFVANSLLDSDGVFEKLPLQLDLTSKNRVLSLFLRISGFWQYTIYTNSPEELPYFNSPNDYTINSDSVSLVYDVMEMYNSEDVEDLEVEERGCRFPSEKLNGELYSFSTCMSTLRVEQEIEKCNCTMFSSSKRYSKMLCDVYQFNCTDGIAQKVTALQMEKGDLCPPTCTAQQLNKVGINENPTAPFKENHYFFEFEVANLPTVRYKREVTLSNLDLVVSIGGVAGLFFGASILNIFEFIYLWFGRILE